MKTNYGLYTIHKEGKDELSDICVYLILEK